MFQTNPSPAVSCRFAEWAHRAPTLGVASSFDILEPVFAVTIPPLMVKQPNKSMAFREEESIELPCLATGQPDPV